MKESTKLLPFIAVLSFILIRTVSSQEINLQFESQRNLFNPRFAALSNSGVAIPEGISSATLNPALVHCWHTNNKTRFSGTIAYAKDSIFSRYIMNVGGSSYINEKTTLGTIYRYMKNDDDNMQNEVVFNFAGRLFDKSLDQGAVNLGVNLRYESVKWQDSYVDSLTIYHYRYKDTLLDSTFIYRYGPNLNQRTFEENRLLFDLGFFQDNIVKGLDFGITFHNLFGYRWYSQTPVTRDTSWSYRDSQTNDSVVVDSSYYVNAWGENNAGNKKSYKRMTIGLSYHPDIMQNKVSLLLPFDLEFIGIFDKNQDIKIGLHTGLEAWLFSNNICLRFGYAYAPKYITGDPGALTLENDHLFSGGLGAYFERISFNVFMRRHDWGIESVVAF
jgi:hypothetical protein